MDRPRASAGTFTPAAASQTTRLPMRIRPPLGRSSPATARSVVVLPQPEGPSRVSCCPASAMKLTGPTAATGP